MQRYPLAMVAYGIGILTLIKLLKAMYLEFNQPWYKDDAGALDTLNNIRLYFNMLELFDPVVDITPKLQTYF